VAESLNMFMLIAVDTDGMMMTSHNLSARLNNI
jgi:hypothetical protein